ncbi:MAG: YceI family protein [Methylophilaceae bacterium]
MKKNLLLASLLLSNLALCNTAMAEPADYNIDNTHSFANWTIRHVASKTSGTFSDVSGKIMLDAKNLAKSSINAKINMLSINSSHAKRDAHIQKEDYLNTAKFSAMTFVSKKIEAKSTTEGVVTGDFTMHGVTKEISFPFKVLGFGSDPWGGYRTGLEAHTQIKASDYGYTWAAKSGSPVGDDIDITLLIEGVKAAPENQAAKALKQ